MEDNNDYIIWDSLPKHLPFNVGFPDKTGYYLYIKEDKSLNGATVSLMDGAGVTIWQISSGETDYIGYQFPVEYNYPLKFDTKRAENKVSLYDKHNVREPKIKDTFTHSIEMNCINVLNQNEALVSNNKKYRFYIQETGNMVIKENYRTTWSSLTTNIEIFEAPYKIVFTPLGEFLLRDKNNYSVWQSLNLITFGNTDDIVNTHKFNLVLSDEGELFVEDENHLRYWSNWSVRLYGEHLRYIVPTIYEIDSCDEYIRNKYIHNIFSNTMLYDVYDDPNNKKTLRRKHYVNNLLPGEDLLSSFGATLSITQNDVIFNHNTVDKYHKKSHLIESCGDNSGIKELKLEMNGLNLYCMTNPLKES